MRPSEIAQPPEEAIKLSITGILSPPESSNASISKSRVLAAAIGKAGTFLTGLLLMRSLFMARLNITFRIFLSSSTVLGFLLSLSPGRMQKDIHEQY